MTNSVSILCTGNEILDGRIEDTNSRFLIASLDEIGIPVEQILACRDDIKSIQNSAAHLLSQTNVLIVSGGLGPTSDDLTREAISEFVGRPLYLDATALADLEELYVRRKRVFDSSNTKQAQFPEGSLILKNPVGTAAGFHCIHTQGTVQKHIFVVPGVPHELKRMFSDHVALFLTSYFPPKPPAQSRYLHIFGRPESKVGELVEKHGVPANISISYRAHYPEIIVKISAKQSDAAIDDFTNKAKDALGIDFIFSEEINQTLDQAVHALLIAKAKTIAVAESCTGGLLGGMLTANAGSSKYFLGGAISYSNEAKSSLLSIPTELIKTRGAVSAEVAQMMAEKARLLLGSDIAISITGIAGPDGGHPDKPVGTFVIGFSTSKTTQSFSCFTTASRAMVRTFACYTALDIARRYLLGYDLRPSDIIGAPQIK